MSSSLQSFIIKDHALFQIGRRGITEEKVRDVLTEPGQIQEVRPGRWVYQVRHHAGDPPREFVLRVLVDLDRKPPEVVTAYRSSKVNKYWREEP